MVEIKPDEISAILRQQLSNFNAGASLEEVGTVLQVGDGIARVYGLNNGIIKPLVTIGPDSEMDPLYRYKNL